MSKREGFGKARRIRIHAEYERQLKCYPVRGRGEIIKEIVSNVADTLGYSPEYVRKAINSILKGK